MSFVCLVPPDQRKQRLIIGPWFGWLRRNRKQVCVRSYKRSESRQVDTGQGKDEGEGLRA